MDPAPDTATALVYGKVDCAASCNLEATIPSCLEELTCDGWCDNLCLDGCYGELKQASVDGCAIQWELYARCLVNTGTPTGCDSLGVLRNPSCDAEWSSLTKCAPIIATYGR